MKRLPHLYPSLLLVVLMAAMFLPLLQQKWPLTKEMTLDGDVKKVPHEDFKPEDWFSGHFQEHREKHINAHFGFRNFMVRFNNQLAFSFFKKVRANGVVVGKDNYLFEEDYIKAYFGQDFVGRAAIEAKIKSCRALQDTLDRMGKTFLLVLAPGKGTFYPEYIPDRLVVPPGTTNYETYARLAATHGIRHIDFNRWCQENKTTSPYSLYPQYGIHWSQYGAVLAADSLLHFIEKERHIDLPDMHRDSILIRPAFATDRDIADGLNILQTLPTFDMAYPQLWFSSDSTKTKPSVLVIGDSYYWQLYNFGLGNAFGEHAFWYYNEEIYPETYTAPLTTDQLNLRQAIARYDVVILLSSEVNLRRLGWNFLEWAEEEFGGRSE